MSAYSDWKCGALSDEDYTAYCNREAAMDRAMEEREEISESRCCENCKHHAKMLTEEPCIICNAWSNMWEALEE